LLFFELTFRGILRVSPFWQQKKPKGCPKAKGPGGVPRGGEGGRGGQRFISGAVLRENFRGGDKKKKKKKKKNKTKNKQRALAAHREPQPRFRASTAFGDGGSISSEHIQSTGIRAPAAGRPP